MDSFGKALKMVRTSKKKTLREVGNHINASISYISDIEHDRKNPPKLDTVLKIEQFLGIKDGSLVQLARKIRSTATPTIAQRVKMNPELSTVLLRADELPDNKKEAALRKFMQALNELEEEP